MLDKIIEELKRAINTEAEGFSFYEFATGFVKDPKGKGVFESLAKDELDHIRALISLSESIQAKGGWLSYREALKRGKAHGKEKNHIFPSVNRIKDLLGDNPTDIDALNLGMKIEEKAIEYYTNKLGEAGEEDERSFYASMVGIEKGHLKLLEWEHDYLTKSGFWCDHMEYTVEGEK